MNLFCSKTQAVLWDLMLRNNGSSEDLPPEVHEVLVRQYDIDDTETPVVFYEPGYNFKSTNLNAFIGLMQMEKVDWSINRRSDNYRHYLRNFANIRVQKADDPDATVSNLHFVILCKDRLERLAVERSLAEKQIETKIFSAGNLGRHPFWTHRYGHPKLANADRLFETGLLIPNCPTMVQGNIDFISEVVLQAIKR